MGNGGLAALRALTLNHQNVGVTALPEVALSPERAEDLRKALHAADVEAFVLATCNRTEVYWRAHRADDDERARSVVERCLPARGLPSHRSVLDGPAAATHLFRVCAGIESLVLGEAEILGQVRSALDASPASGRFLQRVVQAGLRTGGLARAETGIGVGALSVASAAVQLLATTLPLERARVAVVGAGVTGIKAARQLRARGAGELVLLNRNQDRAAAAAEAVGGEVRGLDALADELMVADALVFAIASPTPIVGRAALASAVSARAGRRLAIVDLSMPPVVDAGAFDSVTRVDLSDLERHVGAQRDRRAAEIPKVEAIVAREVHHLNRWADRELARPAARGTVESGVMDAGSAEVGP